MSALSGWTGTPSTPQSAQSQLHSMMNASWHDDSSDTLSNSDHTGSLGIMKGPKPASIFTKPSLQVAVIGNIYWKEPQLRELATSKGDAHAIAHAYQQDKTNRQFLTQISGSFALAIVDATQEITLLAIDPLGIEKLCYGHFDGQLVFSSSVQGVKAHPAVQTRISNQAIYSFFYFHCIPAPKTIYENIYKLQPGELLELKNNTLKCSTYWHLHYQEHNKTSLNSLVAQFHQHLDSSVAKPLAKFKSIGAFLSGGTDSSSVTAALTQVASEPAKTFSIGFDAAGFDESEYAQITVKRFNTQHHDYYVTPQDVYEVIPQIAAYYDEPFGNESAVPTYFCAKLAKESGITNLLAGDGGDEIFAGNTRYLKQKVFEYYAKIPQLLRTALIEPVSRYFPMGAKIPPVRKLQSYIAQANTPLPDRLETYNFLHRHPSSEIFDAAFLSSVDTQAPLKSQQSIYEQADDDGAFLNRMLHLDLKYTLADNDLRKVNGMCDLAGVNVHYPLLDLEIVNFAAKVPSQLKIKRHKLRYFFKYALRNRLDKRTLTKSKHGFGLPFGLWLNTHPGLNRLATDSLDRMKQRGIIHPAYIDALWQNHQSGHTSYYGVMIWQIMMLECWLQAHS